MEEITSKQAHIAVIIANHSQLGDIKPYKYLIYQGPAVEDRLHKKKTEVSTGLKP